MTGPRLPIPERKAPRVDQTDIVELQQVRKRRRRIRRQRVWRNLRRFLLAGALAWGLGTVLVQPFWRIQQISVRSDGPEAEAWGRQVLQDHALEGLHLLAVDPLGIEARLRASPLVLQADLQRWLFPARLELQLMQRKPWAPLAVEGHPAPLLIDETGVVLPLKLKGQPLIPLHCRVPAIQGGQLDHGRLMRMQALYRAYQAGAIRRDGVYDLAHLDNLVWHGEGVAVWLGEADDLARKFAATARLLPLAKEQRHQLEYIDVRFVDHPALKVKSGQEQGKQ